MSVNHLSKLYNPRYKETRSGYFSDIYGVKILHGDSSRNDFFANPNRTASLPLTDGLAMIMKKCVINAGICEIDGMRGTMIELNDTKYNTLISFPGWEISGSLKAAVFRKGDEVLIKSNVPSTGKNPTPGEAGLGPYVYALLLVEIFNEYLDGNPGISSAMLSAWYEFLKIWEIMKPKNFQNSLNAEKQLQVFKDVVINMSDYAYESLVSDSGISVVGGNQLRGGKLPVRAELDSSISFSEIRNDILEFMFDESIVSTMLETEAIQIEDALGIGNFRNVFEMPIVAL